MKNLKLNLLILIFIFFSIVEVSLGQVAFDWAKRYSSNQLNAQIAYDLITDANGNIYVTGNTARGSDVIDMVTIKYNSSGNYMWGKSYDFPGYDYSSEAGRSIALYTNGAKTFIYSAGIMNFWTNNNILVIKYDENGNQLWVKNFSYAPNGYLNQIPKVMSDASGNCYISGGSEEQPYVVKYDSAGTLIYGTLVPKPAGYTRSGSYDMAFDASGNIFITGNCDSSSTVNYYTSKLSSAGVVQWSKIFRGQVNYQSRARKIAIGTSGNVYVTGEYQGTTMDYLTIKYNPLTGDTIWTKKYNGTANSTDFGRLLTLDASENIYVTGVTNYTGNGDMATVKYNSSGVQQWVKVYSGSGGYLDDPKDMVADQSGNIYIAIASDYSYAGKYGIIKYNSIGDSLWSRIYDFAVPGFETPYAITMDNSGNVLATGSSGYENESEFGTIKYNSSGVLLWARKFYGSQLVNDVANGTVTDKNGNVYTVGTTRTNYGDNITVIKYNSAGVEKWVHNRGGGGVTGYDVRDEGKAIGIDSSGNVYFTGTWYYWATNKNEICTGKLDSNGTVKWFNVISGTFTEYGDDIGNDIAVDAAGNSYVTGQLTGPGGDINFITIKYNTLGAEQWSRTYSGAVPGGKDIANAIAIDQSGNVFVTGNSDGTGTGSDIATVKYNTTGTQLWVNRYNGTSNSTDAGNSIVIDKGGNAYVGGMITNVIGNEMGFIIKYKNDATGSERWRRTVNLTATTGVENLVSLKLDTSKTKIYAAGHSYASGLFNTDYTLTKLDSSGTQIWQSIYDNPGSLYDIAKGLALDKNENSYISGVTFSVNSDILTVCHNAAGTFKWSQIFNGAVNGNDLPAEKNPVAVGINGSIYAAGSSYDTITGSNIITIKYKQFSHTLNLTGFIEGFYNSASNSMVSDTATLYLRSTTFPFNKVDSSKSILNSSGTVTFNFSNATDGVNYYLVLKHRNSIETWSNSGNSFTAGSLSYNFSTAANKAYGSNMQQVDNSPLRFAVYGGDVNQDGTVDASDLSIVENDAAVSLSGYVNSDLTGDDFVDAGDLSIVENNASASVSVITP